jgi:hypothetical protein
MSRKIYLHVGLHKTATRFLQRSVFSKLDRAVFEYNPPVLMKLLNERLRSPNDAAARTALQHEIDRLMATDTRRLLISKAGLSGDMYDCHSNFETNLAIMQEHFPQARILFFIRSQADWLLSAYRQSIQKGMFGPIEVFLNFYDGEFKTKVAHRMGGMRNVDARKLHFLNMYRGYVRAYGDREVFLFRYEDFQKDRENFLARLARSLDIPALPPFEPERRHNRSYSALAIQLFCGNMRPPRRPPQPWPPGRNPSRLSPGRLLRNARRSLIKHVFDPLIYRDWDLLARGGMREKLDAIYEHEQVALIEAGRRN